MQLINRKKILFGLLILVVVSLNFYFINKVIQGSESTKNYEKTFRLENK